MKNSQIAFSIILVLGFSIIAEESPSDEFDLPTDTQHFSGKAKPLDSPVAELLALGTGVIYFEPEVKHTIKKPDGRNSSNFHKAFVFSKGTIRPYGSDAAQKSSRISLSTDGWLIIQRGKRIQLVPIGAIRYIDGTISKQIEQDKAPDR